jgi:cyclohexadieny/prephenate dehydrogenase
MAAVLEEAAPGLAEGVIVTDVGSVKGPLADTLPGLLPAGASFVGSHPMAGGHEIGVEHARSDLLEGACCVVTPQPGCDPTVANRLAEFWEALGARIAHRDPEGHDADVAWVSHLPHMIAFAYARALEAAPDSAAEVAGSGFRDFVRIARSDSELWGDILALNHKALAGPLRSFSEALEELARAIEENEPSAVAERERILESAADRLNSLAPSGVTSHTGAHPQPDSARSGGENPEIQAAPRVAATRSVNRNS